MFNVVHRHITFTIPDVLWSEFEQEAGWRGILFQAANVTLRKVMGLECGVVAVLHPYGKDLKVNYHYQHIDEDATAGLSRKRFFHKS